MCLVYRACVSACMQVYRRLPLPGPPRLGVETNSVRWTNKNSRDQQPPDGPKQVKRPLIRGRALHRIMISLTAERLVCYHRLVQKYIIVGSRMSCLL